MHFELNPIAQIIAASGASIAVVLTALAKFLPVWRQGRKGRKGMFDPLTGAGGIDHRPGRRSQLIVRHQCIDYGGFAYEANGNPMSDGTRTCSYDVQNRSIGTSPALRQARKGR